MSFAGAALPLHKDGLTAAATHVGVDLAVLWSVVVVETSGYGFLPDRRPRILFERHTFRDRTKRQFNASHPKISGPAGGYGPPGAHQFERLEEAIACDRRAALESASWGLGQVMGFNAALAGFRDVEDMVAQMIRGENEQILAMAFFMRARKLHTSLQRRDWSAFAHGYNGSNYTKNSYHTKLAAAHSSLSSKGLPDLNLRAVQLMLTYHGFNPGKIDGVMGGRTEAAVTAFMTRHNLPAMTADHPDLQAALREKLPAATDHRGGPSLSNLAPSRSGTELRLIQSLLAYLGRNPGTVDGIPGPRTKSAITDFQRSQGATPTGQADAGLLDALKEETRRAFGHNNVADTHLVQQLLATRGFNPGGIDGLVGPRTTAAIAAFMRTRDRWATATVDMTLVGALLAER